MYLLVIKAQPGSKIESNNSDASIATSDVLSENDKELLNSSDRDHIRKVSDQINRKNLETPLKSSTVNSKHNDLLYEMRQGKYTLVITREFLLRWNHIS